MPKVTQHNAQIWGLNPKVRLQSSPCTKSLLYVLTYVYILHPCTPYLSTHLPTCTSLHTHTNVRVLWFFPSNLGRLGRSPGVPLLLPFSYMLVHFYLELKFQRLKREFFVLEYCLKFAFRKFNLWSWIILLFPEINVSKKTHAVNPLIIWAYLSKTRSNQPHLLFLPVVTPTSPPCVCNNSPIS